MQNKVPNCNDCMIVCAAVCVGACLSVIVKQSTHCVYLSAGEVLVRHNVRAQSNPCLGILMRETDRQRGRIVEEWKLTSHLTLPNIF